MGSWLINPYVGSYLKDGLFEIDRPSFHIKFRRIRCVCTLKSKITAVLVARIFLEQLIKTVLKNRTAVTEHRIIASI